MCCAWLRALHAWVAGVLAAPLLSQRLALHATQAGVCRKEAAGQRALPADGPRSRTQPHPAAAAGDLAGVQVGGLGGWQAGCCVPLAVVAAGKLRGCPCGGWEWTASKLAGGHAPVRTYTHLATHNQCQCSQLPMDAMLAMVLSKMKNDEQPGVDLSAIVAAIQQLLRAGQSMMQALQAVMNALQADPKGKGPAAK